MRLRTIHIAPIIFVVFIVGIGATILSGMWITESTKIPAAFETGEFAGKSNPADIRGSYTFSEISDVFAVPVDALGRAYGVADNPGAFQVKNLEDLYGALTTEGGLVGEIGTDSVRWFVALYAGLPYTPEEDTLLPASASSILRDRLDEDTFLSVKEKMVRIGESVTAAAAETVHSESGVASDTTIKGQTTFGELVKWGVTREEIESALKMPMGKNNEGVRDYCIAAGIEFSTVKSALQELVDSK